MKSQRPLAADAMNFGQLVDAGTAIGALSTFSAAQQISLGGTSGNIAGTLGLSDAEPGEITAVTLRIDAATGNITLGGAINNHGSYSTLSLATAGVIALTNNNISVANLAVNAGLGIDLNGTNAISTLAFSNASNTVAIGDSTSSTIGAVDGVASSSNLASTTAIVTGNISITAAISNPAGDQIVADQSRQASRLVLEHRFRLWSRRCRSRA